MKLWGNPTWVLPFFFIFTIRHICLYVSVPWRHYRLTFVIQFIFPNFTNSIKPSIHGKLCVWLSCASFKVTWYSCDYTIIRILDHVVQIGITVNFDAEKYDGACWHIGVSSQLKRYCTMGLLPDTKNCWLRMRRECRERFPRHLGLVIPTCITARAWRTCRDACRNR